MFKNRNPQFENFETKLSNDKTQHPIPKIGSTAFIGPTERPKVLVIIKLTQNILMKHSGLKKQAGCIIMKWIKAEMEIIVD
jgi:hypothetical protein